MLFIYFQAVSQISLLGDSGINSISARLTKQDVVFPRSQAWRGDGCGAAEEPPVCALPERGRWCPQGPRRFRKSSELWISDLCPGARASPQPDRGPRPAPRCRGAGGWRGASAVVPPRSSAGGPGCRSGFLPREPATPRAPAAFPLPQGRLRGTGGCGVHPLRGDKEPRNPKRSIGLVLVPGRGTGLPGGLGAVMLCAVRMGFSGSQPFEAFPYLLCFSHSFVCFCCNFSPVLAPGAVQGRGSPARALRGAEGALLGGTSGC